MVEYVPFTISLFQQQKGIIYGIDHYKFSNKHLIFVINHIFKRLNFDKRSESVFG